MKVVGIPPKTFIHFVVNEEYLNGTFSGAFEAMVLPVTSAVFWEFYDCSCIQFLRYS
jgi:hypothetical protein